MFSGKLSSGPLRPVCRMRQVLGVSDASLDLIADLVDGSVAASCSWGRAVGSRISFLAS